MPSMSSSDRIRYLVGALYILYGLVKLFMALISLDVPPFGGLSRLPLMSIFRHDDPTVSGHLYEYVFVLFAVYTVLYGLAMFHLIPSPLAGVLEFQHTELILLCVLGAFLIMFYSLVLFTDLPIPKKEEERRNYLIMGLGGGFSFVFLPLLWELLVSFIPVFRTMSKYMRSLIILLAVIAIALVVSFVIVTVSRQRKAQINAKAAATAPPQAAAQATAPVQAPAPSR